jgi:hypothetical protein
VKAAATVSPTSFSTVSGDCGRQRIVDAQREVAAPCPLR